MGTNASPKSSVVWNWAAGAEPFECSIASQRPANTLTGYGRLIYVKKLLPESYTPSRLGRVARLFYIEEEKQEPESIAKPPVTRLAALQCRLY
jgi:hypothetical protein